MSQMPDDITIFRMLREELGEVQEAGKCHDCGGKGYIPWMAGSVKHGRSLWQVCPTCTGSRLGGIA